jgi:hypothetical protein
MADHGFEGGAPPEFLFDLAMNSALLAADLGRPRLRLNGLAWA